MRFSTHRPVTLAAVVVVLVLLAPGRATAHQPAGYLTEAEAATSVERVVTAPKGTTLSRCHGTDRPRTRGSRRSYRHFYCFYDKVTVGENTVLSEPALRIEVHVLPGGRLLVTERVREWDSTPHWIDDPPPHREPNVIGSTFGTAAARLARAGFDELDGNDDGKVLEIAHVTDIDAVLPRLVVCKSRTRDTKGRRTVTLTLGYPRCEGPPYDPPKLPAVRGLTLTGAKTFLASHGISTTAWSFDLGEEVSVGEKGWVVCGYDREGYAGPPGQAVGRRSWEASLTVSRDPCPESWGPPAQK